ncbi:MAG: hypothetical protein AMS19_05025 [Gemmatimonas sp. SG8_23]|jgi:L-fucose isomerase-like protein|nr:MAG: hypothetical protein AMS19_05025 [Gemmatimonas sp. SG8_23]
MFMTLALPVPQGLDETSGIVLASNVAEVVIAAAVLVMTLLAIVLFVRVNAMLRDLRRAAHQSFGPVSDRARAISDNVEFISQALRTDVERLNESVRALTERLQLASERMEERVEEFNALMEVVQGEAEEVFLDTASTVRGVREGARAISGSALGAGGTGSERRGPDAEAPARLRQRYEGSSEENAGAVEEP